MDFDRPPDENAVDNPYAPPQSAFVPEAMPELAAGMPFSVSDVFNWSWAIFKERMGPCLMIVWGVTAINWGISLGLNLLQTGLMLAVRDQILFGVITVLLAFGAFVIQVWLAIGQTMAMLKIARRQPVVFEDVFHGGRYVLTTILASILFGVMLVGPIVIAVALIIPGITMMQNQRGVAAVLLFVVVATTAAALVVLLTCRLLMYYYIVIDRHAGVIDSLRQSWQLTKGRTGTIVLVYCLQLAIIIAGFLALCVGLILAVPLASLLLVVLYVALTGTWHAQPEKPDFIWEEEL
jgi:hypothetical protein